MTPCISSYHGDGESNNDLAEFSYKTVIVAFTIPMIETHTGCHCAENLIMCAWFNVFILASEVMFSCFLLLLEENAVLRQY